MKKYSKYIIWGIIGLVIVLALLWYYQQQGLVKIFPTGEELALQRQLRVDEGKFRRPEGLTDEQYTQKIDELNAARQEIINNPNDPNAWFAFGAGKSFFNDHQGAIEAWEKAYELQMDFRVASSLAFVYQYFIKDYETSERYYLTAIELQPDLRGAYEGLMDLYRFNWTVNADKFEPLVLLAIENDSENSLWYYANLVEFFASEQYRDDDKANHYLAIVKEINSDSAEALVRSYPHLSL